MKFKKVVLKRKGPKKSKGHKAPRKSKKRKATKSAHGYLFLDFTQQCPDDLRVRADIFNAKGETVYKQS